MPDDRLARQIQFVLEIDKLKSIYRRSYLLNEQRNENSAEHSWHVAMLAMILVEHVDEPVDLTRVVKMLLIHDIVEIDADDTFIYDEAAMAGKADAERKAADRIFGLLPEDQRDELIALWHEYEARQTPEARFALAVDRLMPLMHNVSTKGKAWREHGVTSRQVIKVNSRIGDASAELWDFARSRIEEAVAKGHLAE
ncbi:MAG: HD domain-containing protein [Phycisphaerae bacterium]|nr:HD domain-containing protein [Phycisphaerae bacterium]